MTETNVQLSTREQEQQFMALKAMYFYRRHPNFAVRDLTGCQLAPHQRMAFRTLWFLTIWWGISTAFLNFSRRLGKTFLAPMLGLVSCLLYSNQKFMPLGASGFRQGKRILNEAARIIENRIGESQTPKHFLTKAIRRQGKLRQVVKRENDAWTIEFTNGNEIRTIPTGNDPDKWRGEGATTIQIDEKKDLDREIQEKVINPMGYVPPDPTSPTPPPPSRLISMGTVEYADDEYTHEIEYSEDICKRVAFGDVKRSALFAIPIRFDREDTFYGKDKEDERNFWSTPYHMDHKKMLADREAGEVDLDAWNAENKNIPIPVSGAFFPSSLIREAQSKKVNEKINSPNMHEYLIPKLKCNDPVVIGIDASSGGPAFFAMLAVRVGKLSEKSWNSVTQEGKTDFNNVVNVFQSHCTAWQAADKIYEWMERYPHILGIGLDKRGGGAQIADELAFRPADGWSPLIDIDDERAEKVSNGIPLLSLLTPTEVDNTEWAGFGKGQFENHLLFLPKNDVYGDTHEMNETYRFFRVFSNQLVKIKRKPIGRAYKFFMNDNKQKDLFSAFIYAMCKLREVVHTDRKKRKVYTDVSFIPWGVKV